MAGINWAKNLYLGQELSDEQMRDIPRPRLELHTHVLYKTVQVGTILGMGIIAPVVALLRKKPVAATMLRYGRNGAIIGIPAGPLMTETMLQSKKATPESVWDRCYRLRYHKGQVRTDRYASFCALGGLTATSLMGQGALTGLLVGYASGTVLSGVVGNMLEAPQPASKQEEKKE